jgi:hypothetical protein
MGHITTPLLNLVTTLITMVTHSSGYNCINLYRFMFILITTLVIGNGLQFFFFFELAE